MWNINFHFSYCRSHHKKKTIQAKSFKLVVADVLPKELKTHLDVGALQQGKQANESEGKAGE